MRHRTFSLSFCLALCVSAAALPTAGCSLMRDPRKAAETAGDLMGSLYAPHHYADEPYYASLAKMPQGARLTENEAARSFLYEQLGHVNRNYSKYIGTLTSGKAATNVFYDSLNLGLTGAATALSPATTKTVLSGLSTFFQGQQKSVDKNLFDDQAMFALIAIMEIRRTAVLKTIRSSIENPKYTLGEALLDLDEFYRAGTLQTALQASYLNQAPEKPATAPPPPPKPPVNPPQTGTDTGSDVTPASATPSPDAPPPTAEPAYPASTSPLRIR